MHEGDTVLKIKDLREVLGRNLGISYEMRDKFRQVLSGHVFSTGEYDQKTIFLLSVALAKYMKQKRKPFKGGSTTKRIGLVNISSLEDEELWYLASVAFEETRSLKTLTDGPELRKICEEYAHRGIDELLKLTHEFGTQDGFVLRLEALSREAMKKSTISVSGTAVSNLRALVELGEKINLEFKSTLRINLHTKKPDKEITFSVLKTIAAFLNTGGGTLLIGYNEKDDSFLDVSTDNFPDSDKYELFLVNQIRDRIGSDYTSFIKMRFSTAEGHTVYVVDCEPSPSPAYVKESDKEKFFIRQGPSTQELTGSAMAKFLKDRFE